MHAHDHHTTQANLLLAVAGNGFLAIVEASIWTYTGSVLVGLAALHDACDCATSFASCMAHRYENKWPRLPHIAARIMLLLIISSCLVAIVQACRHVVLPEQVNLSYVWLLGVLGLVVNGMLALRLEKGHTFLEHVTSTHFYEDVVAALMLIVEWLLARWVAPERLDPVLALIGAGGILILAFRRGVS